MRGLRRDWRPCISSASSREVLLMPGKQQRKESSRGEGPNKDFRETGSTVKDAPVSQRSTGLTQRGPVCLVINPSPGPCSSLSDHTNTRGELLHWYQSQASSWIPACRPFLPAWVPWMFFRKKVDCLLFLFFLILWVFWVFLQWD